MKCCFRCLLCLFLYWSAHCRKFYTLIVPSSLLFFVFMGIHRALSASYNAYSISLCRNPYIVDVKCKNKLNIKLDVLDVMRVRWRNWSFLHRPLSTLLPTLLPPPLPPPLHPPLHLHSMQIPRHSTSSMILAKRRSWKISPMGE